MKPKKDTSRKYLYVSAAHFINAFCLSFFFIFLDDIDRYFYQNHPKIHIEIGGFFSFVRLICNELILNILLPVIFILYSWYYFNKSEQQK